MAQTGAVSDRGTQIPPAGDHGGDGARIAAALGMELDDVLDLSASLNPFAPDVVALARDRLSALRRYPDVDEAERIAAEMVGVDADHLVLTAGGSQAIALVADHLGEGWVDEPDFSLYRRHLARLSRQAPQWRSDPRSPSGRLADNADNADDTDGADRTGDRSAAATTVWDEAFLPLSAGVWTRGRAGWALGSLTKAFACPGLRLGYAIAPDARHAHQLRQRRPVWAVGGLACALLPRLAELSDPPGWTQQIDGARDALAVVLRNHGLQPLASDAPWLLVKHAPVGSHGLREALAQHAVVVRDCASFGLPDHVRIAVPDEPGLARLSHALDSVEGGGKPSR